jgi:hypothetical protein
MVEFAMILPVFMVLVLGIAQSGLIFINAVMIKYAAFMTARVALAYTDNDIRQKQAGRAEQMLKTGLNAQDKLGPINADMLLSAGAEALSNYISSLNEENQLKVETIKMETSNCPFIKVVFTYDMPLKIPVANKIFGMFQKQPEDITGRLQNSIYPVYTLRSSAIVRQE